VQGRPAYQRAGNNSATTLQPQCKNSVTTV
jgi:hypothetical protein